MDAQGLYHPSPDQLALADELNASLEKLLPVARLHAAPEEGDETWRCLQDLGVFGLAVDEARGGSALGAAEEALVVLGLGRSLASPAVLATMGAAHARAIGSDAARCLRPTAAAYQGLGRSAVIADARAEQVLLRRDGGASILEGGATGAVLDERHWGVRLCTLGTTGEPIGDFDEAGLIRLRLIDAAALAGLAEAATAMAVAYAGVRRQFGHPIGGFQAVKHHCANMAIAARAARDQTCFAAIAVDEGRQDAELQVECAFLIAGSAALEGAAKNIQIHGGIGFSDEADPHLLLKRAQVLLAIAGGLEAAAERIAGLRGPW